MFDFGFWEIVVVLVVALLVVGPERLPGLARKAGVWVGKAKRYINSVRSDIEKELRAEELREMLHKQQDEIQELKGMISDTQADLKTEVEETEYLVKAIEEQIESSGADTRAADGGSEPTNPLVTSTDDAKQSTGK